MKSNGTEGREAKTLITFKLNNPSIVLASLGPLHDALLTPGDNWTRVICSWFLQAPWAPLPAMGILKSRQADLKAVFTALPIPTAVLLVYTATAEIPRIVWYAKWRDFQLLETQCILFELQGRLQNAVTLAYIFPGNSREQRTKESILRYMIFFGPQLSLPVTAAVLQATVSGYENRKKWGWETHRSFLANAADHLIFDICI